MTQKEQTLQFFRNLPKGTTMNRREFEQTARKAGINRTNFDAVVADCEFYGVEKVVDYRITTTSKITAVDVLEMIKQGVSVEDIEKKLYTKVKHVSIRVV